MKISAGITFAVLSLAVACAQGKEKKGGDTKATDEGATDDAETDSSDPVAPADEVDNGLYTGIGGDKDFSLFLPGFRGYTSADETIAKVEKINVTLSQKTIDELIVDLKKAKPDMDEACVKGMFAHQHPAYKVTPVKAGKVKLNSARPKGRKSGGFKDNNEVLNLVITEYTAEQIAAGEKRYSTDGGGGNLVACKSCHEGGKEGAPPHEMGRVMEISDKQAVQWITTGKVQDREAKIQHTWEFASDDEEKGIVAYLRSLQTKDVETLTKLVFAEQQANGFDGGGFNLQGPGGKGCGAPPKDGAGTGSGSGSASGSGT